MGGVRGGGISLVVCIHFIVFTLFSSGVFVYVQMVVCVCFVFVFFRFFFVVFDAYLFCVDTAINPCLCRRET